MHAACKKGVKSKRRIAVRYTPHRHGPWLSTPGGVAISTSGFLDGVMFARNIIHVMIIISRFV